MSIRKKPPPSPQLEDAVNSDERDYDEEAACQPLMVGEHEDEGPSGDHLPDCEMFTDYDGSAGCSCGGFPCESGFSIGPARDPYGVSCEYILRDHPARGGRRIHRGVSPLPGPGPEPQYVEWAGGGYCAGDPLPVRDVVHLAADGEPATGRCEVSSWQGKSQRPYGPGAYNRCIRSSGDHHEHLDEWGNRFIVNPDAAGGQHDPRFRRLA